MDKYLLIKGNLKRYGQEHILNFYDELDENEQENLLNQVLSIDFNQMKELYDNRDYIEKEEGEIEPIPYIKKNNLSDDEKERYSNLGKEVIENEELAVVIMAGGQGTRLGHSGPKGTYILDIDGGKSIFEILVDKLKQIQAKYDVSPMFYIMTSEENNDDTVRFFEENNYFDYPKEKIGFFKQGRLPMLDVDGKVIMEAKDTIKLAADGNGGIFEALIRNKVIEKMKNEDIKWVYVGNVDNILHQFDDLEMLGLAVEKDAKLLSKSLIKREPYEKVGVFYKIDGKPSVIEYTEVTDEMANAVDENGNYEYGQSYIGCNLFSLEALEKIGNNPLPYHTAIKKCNYIDENGNEVISNAPNAYKFESFIFDGFKRLDDLIVFEVNRNETFAPVKNIEGNDSPETAVKLYKEYYNI